MNGLLLVSRIIYWSCLILQQTSLDLMEQQRSQHWLCCCSGGSREVWSKISQFLIYSLLNRANHVKANSLMAPRPPPPPPPPHITLNSPIPNLTNIFRVKTEVDKNLIFFLTICLLQIGSKHKGKKSIIEI
jgi:hypothetical protein